MRLDYVTIAHSAKDIQFEIKMYTPCCTEATALILEKLIEIRQDQPYLMINGTMYKMDYCPSCGTKIGIKEYRE